MTIDELITDALTDASARMEISARFRAGVYNYILENLTEEGQCNGSNN